MARIKSLETAGWGSLEDGKICFETGLNVLRGANEAGKTSSVAAICAGLYEDGATSSETFRRRFRRWNDDGLFFVTLELVHEGGTYLFTRDFGERTNSLVMPDGKALKDKRKIAAAVEGMLGLPTIKSFEASACIRQEEASAVCGEPSLREALERQITGSGSDTSAILKRLDRAVAAILGKSGRNGELADLRTEAGELERELAEKKTKLAELSACKRELASLEKELDAKLLELDTDQAAYAGFRRFLEAEAEGKAANLDFEAAQESLTIHREAAKDAARCESELKMQKKQITALQAEIEKAERFAQEETAVGRLAKDAGVLKKKLETVSKLDKRIGALEKKLESAAAVPRKDLEKARVLAGEVSSLRSALSRCVFGIEVQPESSTTFTMTADGKTIKGKRAKAHVDADIEFPGAGAVRIKNLTGEKEPLVEQVERAQERLTTLLAKHGVAEVGGLERLHTEREALETERRGLEDRKSGLLGDDDCEELKATLRDLEVELGRAQRARDKNLAASLTSEVLKTKKAELRSLESERRETERKLSEADGVFNVLGKDEKVVRKLLDKATKRLLLANEAVSDNAAFACSATEYARKERKLERLRVKVDDLKARKPVLEARISSADSVGQEEVAATQERLSQKEAAIERFEREREVLATISENIRNARKSAVAGLSGGMEKRMGAVLAEITDAKYNRASVDGNLDMRIYSPDKAEFIGLGNGDEAFSAGTRDQVYLSARIALLETITGGSRTPLILDDTFANFDDMGRRQRAFEILEAVAAGRQVLYFTCHECPDRFRPIEIGGPSTTVRSRK